MFDRIDLRGIIGGSPKRCGPCQRERDREVDLEATTEYVPSQAVYCEVWQCPECGFMTYRGDDPAMIAPDGERL